ncbi:hypothetical protein [Nocardioides marmoriginsengisoli]|nr:hypothetical protein [Nocardioides marmoriginsengisoli]
MNQRHLSYAIPRDPNEEDARRIPGPDDVPLFDVPEPAEES